MFMDENPNETEHNISAQLAPSIASLDAVQWDACNDGNPFTSHAFLSALEDSGSVGTGSGWASSPIIIKDEDDNLLAALPSYLKSHSRGEYIFDNMWAEAYMRAGGQYYPKLQIAAPFSPVPGPRLLMRDPKYAPLLLRAAEMIAQNNGLSSVHATFISPDQIDYFHDGDWLIRNDSQFHWRNQDYQNFDDFLAKLSSRKRKNIRKERQAAQDQVDFQILQGDDIKAHHWDIFWQFYLDTSARKWGSPYLTREFFDIIAKKMADKIVLFLAYPKDDDQNPIAGALNFVGPDCLYGRYWGALRDVAFLHFETCYYQAIDWAIKNGLKRVEAGAQGPHKLARGYEPVTTYSAHYIADPGFREAIDDYLSRERHAVAQDIAFMSQMGPFKKSD